MVRWYGAALHSNTTMAWRPRYQRLDQPQLKFMRGAAELCGITRPRYSRMGSCNGSHRPNMTSVKRRESRLRDRLCWRCTRQVPDWAHSGITRERTNRNSKEGPRKRPFFASEETLIRSHRWFFCLDQRHVDQVFAQKPGLQFVGAQHIANGKIIGAVIPQLVGAFGQLTAVANDDLVRIEQARDLHRNFFAIFRRPLDLSELGNVMRHRDGESAEQLNAFSDGVDNFGLLAEVFVEQ